VARGQSGWAADLCHWCYPRLLRSASKPTVADADIQARRRRAMLIFCGGYVDGGPASRQVLDARCWLKRWRPCDMLFLKGNHEQVLQLQPAQHQHQHQHPRSWQQRRAHQRRAGERRRLLHRQRLYGRVGLSQFDLVDLERIEVLRGPQGTLFGKNTTSGVINITSRKPSFQPELSAEVSVGDYGFYQLRGSASAAIDRWGQIKLRHRHPEHCG
jgi:hypothetical protein